MYRVFLKRVFDVLAACFLLVISSPLLMVLAVLIRLLLGSPVLFIQERVGKGEKIFPMYKFRSMTDRRDEQGNPLSDEQRLTRFGAMLRSASLDELPELLNIVKGDMSLIGPRPLLVRYLPRYTETQRRRHAVRPGITGLAQVNGRNSISWDEKFAYDVFYVDNHSFIMDIGIVLKSIKVVLTRSDINSATSISMEEFLGSE